MEVGFFICGGCIVIMGPRDFVRGEKMWKNVFFLFFILYFFWSPLSYVRFLQHFVGKNFCLLPFNSLITEQPKFFNPSFSSFSLLVLLPIYYIFFFFFLYFKFFFEKATSTLTQREELISDFEMCVLIVERVENNFFNLKLF
jgi:hypothetical protein